ncbi:hypothetical protein BDY24DRAFT_412226 [Mrakia frigida]|uniref:uncharacterized protein n=1 Tax=Mrakia frigida TaxID=29902 RepID=UPI003FCBF3EA
MSCPSSAPPSLLLPISPALKAASLSSESPQPNKTSTQPLPLLPTELKREILRFCDPSTLAKTSLVSLAFLQLSSPILYLDIEVVGVPSALKLFCERDPLLHQPHLEPYLSLHQLRSFTFLNDEYNHLLYDSILHKTRIASPSGAISVEMLSIGVASYDLFDDHLWEQLFPLFDPQAVVCFGSSVGQTYGTAEVKLSHATWPSIQTLTLRNCIITSPFNHVPFLLGPLIEEHRVTLYLDMSEAREWPYLEEIALLELEGSARATPLLDLLGVKEVVLRVRSVEKKERMENEIFSGKSLDVVKKWKSRLRFEVVEDDEKPLTSAEV